MIERPIAPAAEDADTLSPEADGDDEEPPAAAEAAADDCAAEEEEAEEEAEETSSRASVSVFFSSSATVMRSSMSAMLKLVSWPLSSQLMALLSSCMTSPHSPSASSMLTRSDLTARFTLAMRASTSSSTVRVAFCSCSAAFAASRALWYCATRSLSVCACSTASERAMNGCESSCWALGRSEGRLRSVQARKSSSCSLHCSGWRTVGLSPSAMSIMARSTWCSWCGGTPSAISMRVTPSDQMSALLS
mmetsp:Transcript_8130/g.25188  ORF Transcript_8130/g.25188 Transcript_8130/m.25188 type:complete len:248 (+) Transcript_8130:491-1234(+)